MDIFEEIVALRQRGENGVIVTITEAKGSVPREAGAKMLVKADGSINGTVGGGTLEKRLIEEAMVALKSETPKSVHFDLGKDLSMSCGGAISAFIEPLIRMPQLIIFGAGHIGSVLTKIAKMLGFRVVVADNRPEFANSTRLPDADILYAESYQNNLAQINFDSDTYIVIVTHQHAHDQQILEYCVRKPFAYIGMIGSKTKVKKAFEQLRNKGVEEEMIAKIYSPIGLEIGAQTPAEIAVSIAAELIAVKNRG